jgi:hypothetical protein
MSNLSQRPTYTPEQLSEYLSVLFHESHPLHSLSSFQKSLEAAPLETLSILQRYHLSKIPWGDVALHYSKDKCISLDAGDIFEKLITRRHGGYCMEVNTFYSTVLRSLGIKLYTTGARISNNIDHSREKDPEGFNGWYDAFLFMDYDNSSSTGNIWS